MAQQLCRLWRAGDADAGAGIAELEPSALDWYPLGQQLALHTRHFASAFLHEASCSLLLGTEVTAITQTAEGWRVDYRPCASGRKPKEAQVSEGANAPFDVIIVACGMFSRPRVPFPDEGSSGRRWPLSIHSLHLVDMEVLRGLRVVVVGMGKSACDITMAAAHVAKSIDAVARDPTWMLPRHIVGLPLRFLASTRWFATMALTPWRATMAQALQWFLWAWILEPLVRWHFGRVPAAWRPADGALRAQLSHGRSLAIVDAPALQDVLTQPHVRCLRAQPLRVTAAGLVVRPWAGDAPAVEELLVEADAIVWATGYESDAMLSLFDRQTVAKLRGHDGSWLALYRRILPLSEDLRGLAFIGRVLTTSDVAVSFVQAEWLAAVWCGAVQLPTMTEQAAEVEAIQRESRRFSSRSSGHADVAIPSIHSYLDELVAEVVAARRRGEEREEGRWRGLSRRASGLVRWLSMYVRPLRAADYAELLL